MYGTLFAALTLSGSPSALCPNLTSFLFGDLYPQGPDPWNNVIAMIHSRFDLSQKSRCRLEFLHIFHYGILETPSEESWAGFQRVRDEGLDTEFLGGPATEALLESTSKLQTL
ncbi:hypothetical protein C8R46DRAFT_425036 [Mycena filopes]|nr:hypothetical protein C8R46DRAFT_425036 [Mycena filopes]